jgi:ADP-ribose pyrophosphatase YjhB (NUDIX family)
MAILKSTLVQTVLVRAWGLPLPRPLRRAVQWVLSPKFIVGVVALVFDDAGRLLLLRHTYKHRYPWGLPGGGMDYGETTEQAALRELREEAGVEGEIVKLLGIRTDRKRRLIDAFYLCRAGDQHFQPSPEIAEFGYFPITALPEGTSPLLRDMVERFLTDGHLPPETLDPHITDDGV